MIVDCHATIWETSEQLGQMADTIRRTTGGHMSSAHPAAHTGNGIDDQTDLYFRGFSHVFNHFIKFMPWFYANRRAR